MPDEEMEMSVDFLPGFCEDIDIDLDFPAGQVHEDMELEDFDGIPDMQNSDVRDELMAEGDDLSCGMVDAIEIDHNLSAVAANDSDIELGNTVASIWQQTSVPYASFDADAEIDYFDETSGDLMDEERNDVQDNEGQQPAAGAIVHANGLAVDILPDVLETPGDIPLRDSVVSREGNHAPLETPQNDTETTLESVAGSSEDLTGLDVMGSFSEVEIHEAEAQIFAEDSSGTRQDEHGADQATADAEIKSPRANSPSRESDVLQETGHSDEIEETEHVRDDESYVYPESKRLDNYDNTEKINVNEDPADLAKSHQPEEEDEAHEAVDADEADETDEEDKVGEEDEAEGEDETANDFGALERHLGGSSYIESTNDQTDADDNAPQVEGSDVGHSYPEHTGSSPDQSREKENNEVATVADAEPPTMGDAGSDDPIGLANHYGVYITYGTTDYSLFADSEDDDPNQYFLEDKTTLNLSLAQFLASLREVVSEEISPLDELVMHVDGLSLEFSEVRNLIIKSTFSLS